MAAATCPADAHCLRWAVLWPAHRPIPVRVSEDRPLDLEDVLGPDAGRAVGVRAHSVKRPAAGGRHDAGLVPVPARQIAAPGVSRRSLLNTGATFRSAPSFFDFDLTGRKPACVQPDAGYVGGRRREATACGWGDPAAGYALKVKAAAPDAGVDTCDVMSFSSL
jgi:hypothetical protein